MARVTVEDCIEQVGDHFALVNLATKRYRQLQRGAPRLYNCPKNKNAVCALREIAAKKVKFSGNLKEIIQERIDVELRRQIELARLGRG
ncbi:MAG: DNA-directed RNA polymerase subunit omega [Deltaproteobacteria bacterium]|nr:DNA-directed RNA polymerase subunit omega [Deltaproteobacteria bacterium]